MIRHRLPALTVTAVVAALPMAACTNHNSDPANSSPQAQTIQRIKATTSKELHAAIKAATAKAVYSNDEFGKENSASGCSSEQSSIRIAGWDPDEMQSNEELIAKSTAYLEKRGWKVSPLATDSDDQAARITKTDVAEGLLTAADQGLTFKGKTVCTTS
ncbi:hypothetical protein [Streptomyces sp. NPDC001020]